MKRYFKIIAPFFFFLVLTEWAWSKPPYWVYAYINNNVDVNGNPITFGTDIPWSDITVLVDTFAIPAKNGALTTTSMFGSTLVSAAHTNSTRACFSIGGEGNAQYFTSDTGTYETTFISNITKTVSTMDYDGVDIDWEFPTASQESQFMTFMQNLYTAIKAMPNSPYDNQPRTLTVYIGSGESNCAVDYATIGNMCDAVVIGGYDFGYDQWNGPIVDTANTMQTCDGSNLYADLTSSYSDLKADGLSPSKMVLGCPLYADYPPQQYNEVSIITLIHDGTPGAYSPGGQMEQAYTYEGDATSADTAQAYCDKINWALGNGMKGIGLWEVAMGCPITDSAVTGIWSTIGGNSACLNLPTSTPSSTPTATCTATKTPSQTSSSTRTPSPSPSLTASPTATPSGSPSLTRSATPTLTTTPTPFFSPMDSPTRSLTASSTPSLSPTFSESPAVSPTETPSISLTPTPSPSSTPSGSLTDTPSFSPSLTPSLSSTVTPSWTPSFSPMPSPSATPIQTPTESALVTPLTSPGSGEGINHIQQILPMPNPNPQKLYFEMEGNADTIRCQIYTRSMICVQDLSFPGQYHLGWNNLSLPKNWDQNLGNDAYFMVLESVWQGKANPGPKPVTLYLLK